MEKESSRKVGEWMSVLVIPIALVLGIVIYLFVLGNPANFVDNDITKDPLTGNYLGVMYKGGFIVPILMALFLTVVIFGLERFFSINAALGKGDITKFVRNIQGFLKTNDLDAAVAACDEQHGSVANVVKNGIRRYALLQSNTELNKEQKLLTIKQEIEEATTLEMPMLEKNLSVISTIASIATLFGLLGTVLGMVRAFAALAHTGAPDASALATGISEALVNTALGISASALAIILYNYFTGKIDALTYRIDEVSFSINQTAAATLKEKTTTKNSKHGA